MVFRENVGTAESPAFGPSQINPFGLVSTYYNAFPKLVDIDNDGDFDLFVSEYQGALQFFENIGTLQAPSFGAPVANPFGTQLPMNTDYRTFDFADVDKDGDKDLITHLYDFTQTGSRVYYQENIGNAETPSFGSPIHEPSGIFFDGWYFIQPAFADIDNDGDKDLFVGTYYEYGGLTFFQNLHVETGTTESNLQAEINLAPNPSSGVAHLKIKFPEAPDELDISVTDLHGRVQRNWQEEGVLEEFETQLDLYGLPQGMYLIQIRSGERFTALRLMRE